eukprot:GFUD01014071.1.p1 GENE.GFUD01014071.1~~GFUD01014071.1.p1  ORF type:complete len:179 (-),score=62.56 GFUD01014071.1:87-623(-)
MGCLLSCCCGGEEGEGGQDGERTRLLSECNSQTQVPSGLAEDFHCNMTISNSMPRQNDESSKLTEILTDFAEEIIDISVVEHVDTLEHQEVSERLAHYTHKLGMHGPKIVKEHGGEQEVGLEGLTMKEMGEQLEGAQISEEDRTLVCRVAKQVESMVASMRVEQNEDTQDIVCQLGEE